MQSQAKTVSAYLKEVPAERREALFKLRKLCRATLTGFKETMEYGGPCYSRNGVVEVGFASQKTAFPDLDYHFKIIGAEGDVVRSTSQLSGTHTGSFDLTSMNMGVIPATNKSFSAKLEKTRVTVKDDKITSWAVEPTDGAGLMAILKQLDVKLPTI